MGQIEERLRALETRLGADPEAYLLLAQLRDDLAPLQRAQRRLERSQELLRQAASVLGQRGLVPAATGVLDLVLQMLGARRGFVGLVAPDGSWDFLAARHVSQADIDDPAAQTSRSIITRALERGEPVVLHNASAQGPLRRQASVAALKLRSVACFPLPLEHESAFVYLDDTEADSIFDPAALDVLRAWLPAFVAVLRRERLEVEAGSSPFPGVLTESQALRERLAELRRIARFDVPVLLHGETGTGKTQLARALHDASGRAGGPFAHINCSAIPTELLEGELFGAEKGAYTGADRSRPGAFEAAAGGTVFLDELTAMPTACQAKLLVAIQSKQVTRLGATRPRDLDVRFVAALPEEPQAAIDAGTLREDLFYRLGVIVTRLPPLRERPEDVALLSRHALARACQRYGVPGVQLSEGALAQLQAHPWPGNVRQLENALDRAALLCEGQVIQAEDLVLPPANNPDPAPASPGRRRGRVPREEFVAAWEEHQGNVRQIAWSLGIAERSVHRLRKRFLD